MQRLNTIAELRKILTESLNVGVYVNAPQDPPTTYVLIRREGGAKENYLVDRVGVGITCYAESEQKAFELADSVSGVMSTIHKHRGFISASEEVLRSDYDLIFKRPRWYGSYTLRTYKPKG